MTAQIDTRFIATTAALRCGYEGRLPGDSLLNSSLRELAALNDEGLPSTCTSIVSLVTRRFPSDKLFASSFDEISRLLPGGAR